MPESAAVEKRVVRKITLHLIPLMFALYILAYLDRINVGFAALQMNADLNLSGTVFGVGSGIFFIGYFLFEIPSNLILHRIGARFWIARIMVSWGIISSAMMFVQGPKSFYGLRFLLGLAEAGFFPGMILYLTYWFPAKYLARNVALFMTATAVAGIIGGPLSGALLTFHGFLGLAGWQWLFLLEGIPSVILGIGVWFLLTDRPPQAKWLTAEEKQWLDGQLKREAADRPAGTGRNLREVFRSGRVWTFCAVYFALVVGLYAISLWMPLILRSLSTMSNLAIGLVSTLPYFAACIAMVLIGKHSDRSGERRGHAALALLIAAVGMALSAFSDRVPAEILCFMIAAVGIWGALGPFWAFSSSFLTGAGAAGGIALINSIGNLGGFTGPSLIGILKDHTGDYESGMLVVAVLLAIGAALTASIRTR